MHRSLQKGRCTALDISGLRHSRSLCCPDYSLSRRSFHRQYDSRQRLSAFYVRSGGVPTSATDAEAENAHQMLVRAGFLRQAYSGMFHFLPLGTRVQEKLERLIEKHMGKLGASKMSLSSFTSEPLWKKSGRLENGINELFRVQDRRKTTYFLSPTHEEEITSIVGQLIKSYKELPIRLYQISRKFRDELRPRQGLLRAREFVMKDLYTFDVDVKDALDSYQAVRDVYSKFFEEFKIPYMVAEADSGSIGGDISHEYHFPMELGEDELVSCTKCNYVANREVAQSKPFTSSNISSSSSESEQPDSSPSEAVELAGRDTESSEMPPRIGIWSAITHDRRSLVNVFYTAGAEETEFSAAGSRPQRGVLTRSIKQIIPDLHAGYEEPIKTWLKTFKDANQSSKAPSKIINLYDYRLSAECSELAISKKAVSTLSELIPTKYLEEAPPTHIFAHPETGQHLNLFAISQGEPCPRCEDGQVKIQKAVEIGHTFFLGSRYSQPLRAFTHSIPMNHFRDNNTQAESESAGDAHQATKSSQHTTKIKHVALQMGCHGIGISRMIGAVAGLLADEQGLNWPRAIAPFEVIIIPAPGHEEDATQVYDTLSTARPPQSSSQENSRGTCASQMLDVVLDDRPQLVLSRMKDANLMGIPVVLILGKRWKADRNCEVRCRKLDNMITNVPLDDLPNFVFSLLEKL